MMNNDNIPYGFNSEGDSMWDEPIRSYRNSKLKLSKQLDNNIGINLLSECLGILMALKMSIKRKLSKETTIKVRTVVGHI